MAEHLWGFVLRIQVPWELALLWVLWLTPLLPDVFFPVTWR